MAEVPEDVKALAREALAAEFDGSKAYPFTAQRVRGGLCDNGYQMQAICRALMADRERKPSADPVAWRVRLDGQDAWAYYETDMSRSLGLFDYQIEPLYADRLTRQDPDIRRAALEEAANDPATLDRVASAIEAARFPDREGPYGLYDYTGHTGGAHKPHCVRDFRDPNSEGYGAFILCTNDRNEAAALYGRLTREHIAAAAIRALSEKTEAGNG